MALDCCQYPWRIAKRLDVDQWAHRSAQVRQTRYVMLVKIASKDSETVVNALIKHAGKLPQELYKSLTWDRGTEMANHKRFTIATDIAVYFCRRLPPDGVGRTRPTRDPQFP
ncbi:IS30 family transposase [Paraburkholderia youngii]